MVCQVLDFFLIFFIKKTCNNFKAWYIKQCQGNLTAVLYLFAIVRLPSQWPGATNLLCSIKGCYFVCRPFVSYYFVVCYFILARVNCVQVVLLQGAYTPSLARIFFANRKRSCKCTIASLGSLLRTTNPQAASGRSPPVLSLRRLPDRRPVCCFKSLSLLFFNLE